MNQQYGLHTNWIKIKTIYKLLNVTFHRSSLYSRDFSLSLHDVFDTVMKICEVNT